jgi:hypothetical protein
MKRFLFLLALALLPAALFAQADRDVLLTPGGTLYTAETVLAPNDPDMRRQVTLTIQQGDNSTRTVVPDSLTSGIQAAPALAYDPDSGTLFVFWLRMPNVMSSELLLTAYRDGVWDKSISIDNKPFDMRSSLRIAVKRQVAQLRGDGTFTDVSALVVHATWWEQTGDGEAARYALVSINKGNISSIELHDLTEFMAPDATTFTVAPNFNVELLKHPAILDSLSVDSVDVVFGDLHTNSFNRVTLRPIADGRIHIPIGMRPGGGHFGAPVAFSADWNGRISTISSGSGSNLILYNATKDSVTYLLYSNGVWSPIKTLPLTDKLTAEGAVSALTRMANTQ